jgi:tetratricopeptide (TPR) repeat protein
MAPVARAGELAWHERYLKGVRLVEQGHGADARSELEKALVARPASGLQVPTSGVRYIDYLPHLYLAAACHMSGDIAEAKKHLAQAEREGIEGKSAAGRSLLGTYRLLLGEPGTADAAPRAPAPTPKYREFQRKPPILSEATYTELKRGVLSRCHLSLDTDPKKAPWYFHYELGRELFDRGDPQRALDAFIEAATVRAQPQRNARIYGMWSTDYMPYFQIARAHAKLQNWDCANDALTISMRESEIAKDDKEFAEMRELVAETKRKTER